MKGAIARPNHVPGGAHLMYSMIQQQHHSGSGARLVVYSREPTAGQKLLAKEIFQAPDLRVRWIRVLGVTQLVSHGS
jgi:hypothetical protein